MRGYQMDALLIAIVKKDNMQSGVTGGRSSLLPTSYRRLLLATD
jgi:hypothetical protein